MQVFSRVFSSFALAHCGRACLWASVPLAAVGGIALVATAVVDGGSEVSLEPGARDAAKLADAAPSVRRETRVLENGQWLDSVRSGRFFKEQRQRRSSSRWSGRSRLGALDPNAAARNRRSSVTRSGDGMSGPFRTVCVRLCDGYYYPISTSTTRGRFGRDEKACASSCAAPTRLYYQPAAGDASDMIDRKGRKYIDLRTAYLYRTTYNSNCKCRPDPWEQEARDQHSIYALQEQHDEIRGRSRQARQERRTLDREIAALRTSIKAAERETRSEQRETTQSAMASISKSEARRRVDQFTAKPDQ